MQAVLPQRQTQWRPLLLAGAVTVALHGFLFVLIGAYLWLCQLFSVVQEPVDDGGGEDLPLIVQTERLKEIRDRLEFPEEEQKTDEEKEEEPEEPEQRPFMRTDPRLAQEDAPEKTDFDSDKNTRGASELPPKLTDGNPALPTQRGEMFERSPSLLDSRFQEDQKGESQPAIMDNRADPKPLVKPEEDKPEPSARPEKSEGGQPAEDKSKPPRPVPDAGDQALEPLPLEDKRPGEKPGKVPDLKPSPEPDTEDKIEPPEPDKTEEKKPEEKGDEGDRKGEKSPAKKSEKAAKPKSGGARKPRRKLQSYASEQRKSQMDGSISRLGKASVNARNTPAGRYYARILKAVEIEWQRQATKHRDVNMPGSLRISFQVDKDGRVTRLRTLSAAGVATIQKGYTMRSIREAGIPRMPAEVAKEMQGEPFEMVITFNY